MTRGQGPPRKLTDEQVIDARQRVARGDANISDIMYETGLSRTPARQMLIGVTYRDLPYAVKSIPYRRGGMMRRSDVAAMRRMSADNPELTYEQIAAAFGAKPYVVAGAVRGKYYRSVEEPAVVGDMRIIRSGAKESVEGEAPKKKSPGLNNKALRAIEACKTIHSITGKPTVVVKYAYGDYEVITREALWHGADVVFALPK